MTTDRVRLASPGDQPVVEHLLRTGFGDEEEFLCAFFNHLYPHYDTLLSMDGDDIAAMAILISCRILAPGKPAEDALYLYSLTTLPAFRGRGHAQKLLNAAKEKCSRVFLHAADDSLFAMYAARGWRSMMHVRQQEIPAVKPGFSITRLRGKEYRLLREKYLHNTPHIAWDETTMRFLDDLLFSGNGGLYACDDGIAAVLSREDNNCLPVAEALGKNALSLAAALAYMNGCPQASALIPCTAEFPGAFAYAQGVGEAIPDPIQLSFVFL